MAVAVDLMPTKPCGLSVSTQKLVKNFSNLNFGVSGTVIFLCR